MEAAARESLQCLHRCNACDVEQQQNKLLLIILLDEVDTMMLSNVHFSPMRQNVHYWDQRKLGLGRGKEAQTAVVWSCLLFIRSGQNHLARHSKRGKKTRQTEEEVGRQHQGMDRPGLPQVPEGSGEQGKMEKTGCEVICDAPTTLVVKE